MVQTQEFPKLMARFTMAAGLIGAGTGVVLGLVAGDALGWALLRVSLLAAVFAYATRTILLIVLKGWIQARLDQLLQHAQSQSEKNEAARRRA